MKKVKITVLKTNPWTRNWPGSTVRTAWGPMSHAAGGQVFYGDYAKPEGLCDEAWKAMYQYDFCPGPWGGRGLILLWGLDWTAWCGHLQLQRWVAACDL